MDLALTPFRDDFAEHACPACSRYRVGHGIDDVDVLAQNIAADLYERI